MKWGPVYRADCSKQGITHADCPLNGKIHFRMSESGCCVRTESRSLAEQQLPGLQNLIKLSKLVIKYQWRTSWIYICMVMFAQPQWPNCPLAIILFYFCQIQIHFVTFHPRSFYCLHTLFPFGVFFTHWARCVNLLTMLASKLVSKTMKWLLIQDTDWIKLHHLMGATGLVLPDRD